MKDFQKISFFRRRCFIYNKRQKFGKKNASILLPILAKIRYIEVAKKIIGP
jgi:hypothetical protein